MADQIDLLTKKVNELEKRIKDLEADVYNLDDYIPAHTLLSKAIIYIDNLKTVGAEDFQKKFKINNYRADSLIKILSDYGYLSKEKGERGRRMVLKPDLQAEPLTGEDDPLLAKAGEVVMQYDYANASLIQRKLAIGYARAARILDQLEVQKILGPAIGSKPREVLKKSPQHERR